MIRGKIRTPIAVYVAECPLAGPAPAWLELDLHDKAANAINAGSLFPPRAREGNAACQV